MRYVILISAAIFGYMFGDFFNVIFEVQPDNPVMSVALAIVITLTVYHRLPKE